MMPKETYATARVRLLAELKAKGWKTSPFGLKRPWAELEPGVRLWFRAQSVYLNDHSLFLDIRGMGTDALVSTALRSSVTRANSL